MLGVEGSGGLRLKGSGVKFKGFKDEGLRV